MEIILKNTKSAKLGRIKAKAWKASGWAYIADCSKMEPVSPAEGHFETVEQALAWLKEEVHI